MNDFNFDFKKEMKFIFRWAFALDLIVYGISLIFLGINFSMVTGLLLGNIILFINLSHLYKSILKITAYGGKSKNPMMSGYLIRSFIVCTGLAVSLKCGWINTIGTVLPVFYPKLIYTFYSIVKGGK